MEQFCVKIGDYKVGHTLGRGAFGKVRLGAHIKTGQKVAIKILNKRKMALQPNHNALREIEVMRKINLNGGHPNVCKLITVIDVVSDICLVLELASGSDLFELVVN